MCIKLHYDPIVFERAFQEIYKKVGKGLAESAIAVPETCVNED